MWTALSPTSRGDCIAVRSRACGISSHAVWRWCLRVEIPHVSWMPSVVRSAYPAPSSGRTAGCIVSDMAGRCRSRETSRSAGTRSPPSSHTTCRRGIKLDLFSPQYRYSDLAFARTVPVKDVHDLLKDYPVRVIDTGFAIHLQSPEVDKGTGFLALAKAMGLETTDFLVIGDGLNDIPMLELGRGECRGGIMHIQKPEKRQIMSRKAVMGMGSWRPSTSILLISGRDCDPPRCNP